jgi:hypothetical protein
VQANLAVVSKIKELEAIQARGQVLLVHGDLAKEQLMPKKFPFYNPDEHRHIVALLEAVSPAAVIAATAQSEMAAFVPSADRYYDFDTFGRDGEERRLAEQAGNCRWRSLAHPAG